MPHDVALPNGKTIKLQIWDTAGEEKYRSMTQFYYRKAAAAIVVFAVNDRVSFSHVSQWVKDLRLSCPDAVIFIAGNKCDVELKKRAVSETEAQQLAERLRCEYVECSALNDTRIVDLFHGLAESVFNKPECWAVA